MEVIKEKYQKTTEKEIEANKFEASPQLLQLKELISYLKNKKEAINNPEEYKQKSFETYKNLVSLFLENNGEFVTDVNDIYKKYQDNISFPFIVRRDDPEKVAELSEGKDINLSFDSKVVGDRGDKYANCSIWPYGRNAVSGIKAAFLEGRGMAGPLVTLIGVRNNSDHMNIDKPKDSLERVGTIDREAVRIVSGNIAKEDLEFIILRIQKEFFPPENMSEEEKSGENKQIFRGIIF
jgi:hypothetical protein